MDKPSKDGPAMRDANRREDRRVQAVFRVTYNTLDKLVTAYTDNISKGGIYIKTSHLLPLNAMVAVKLVLPGTDDEVSCIGQVARVHNQGDSPHIPTGMAVVFRDMPRAGMERIEACIARLTLEEAASVERAPMAFQKRQVLVVDDDALQRERAAAIFREMGHDVATAEDGLKGLAFCLRHPPDIVFTDVQMPKMDGWNFLRTLRARSSLSQTLVIFQTSLNSEKDRLLGYQLGVDDYIAKPYAPQELRARIERLLVRSTRHQTAKNSKALRGDMEHVTLPTVLTLLELERKTGVLTFLGDDALGRMFVRDGRPLVIEVDGMAPATSQLSLARLLFSWRRGQFEFSPQDVPATDLLQRSMQGLMMEVARISDEANR
ncbi:MAG: response regulator [Myxococcales bacterium]|jgi:uncharacterized protein (TIGR02266 family)|nr:response regulator [Myxococcales bacterium]